MRKKLYLDLPDGELFQSEDEYCLFMDLPVAKAEKFLEIAELRSEDIVAMKAANAALTN